MEILDKSVLDIIPYDVLNHTHTTDASHPCNFADSIPVCASSPQPAHQSLACTQRDDFHLPSHTISYPKPAHHQSSPALPFTLQEEFMTKETLNQPLDFTKEHMNTHTKEHMNTHTQQKEEQHKGSVVDGCLGEYMVGFPRDSQNSVEFS